MMKRLLKKLSLFGLLFGGVLLLLILLLAMLLHHKKTDYLMGFFVKRDMLIEKCQKKTPAVILLGGSNVAYGFNSGMIQEALNMPVINAGLTSTVGLKFTLDNTLKYLEEGDILVIAPEYDCFYGNAPYGSTELAVLFFMDPSISDDFNTKQFQTVIFRTKELLKYYISTLSKAENDIFTVSGFNEHGDFTNHLNKPPRLIGHLSVDEFKTINTNFLDYYENAIAALRNRGIRVIIIPPSLAETSYKKIEEGLMPLFSEFDRRDLNFSIPPQESVYPDSLFFDSVYHLGSEGLMIRTGQLLKLLKSRS